MIIVRRQNLMTTDKEVYDWQSGDLMCRSLTQLTRRSAIHEDRHENLSPPAGNICLRHRLSLKGKEIVGMSESHVRR